MPKSKIFKWNLKNAAELVAPNERLPWLQTVLMGLQHVVAMFGATVIAPLLMGFDPNLAILMSGIGTLIFFLAVQGRIPSYLGSSFAFIGVVISATAYSGQGANPNIATALGGIIACGAIIALVGLLVMIMGASFIEKLMPPVVSGAVIAVIGLNLAPVAVKNAMGSSDFDAWMAILTIFCMGNVAVFSRGIMQRLLILVGLIISYFIYMLLANGLGFAHPIDFSRFLSASWLGFPELISPRFDTKSISLIAPVAVILIAENLGHIKAVAAMTGRNFDNQMGKAFLGDGLATMLSGSLGGPGVTTYAENIGVMAVTKVYSTLVFVIAAFMAIILGFSPKFGALIQTIPGPIMGGVSVVVFGLIAVAGARIWVQNKVDFSDNRNLIVVAVTLILGAGNFSLTLGSLRLDGIGTATFAAIILHLLLKPAKQGSEHR
jgi:putative pyrimidine permease RutG